jgi:flagellar motor switch protein FliG
VTDNEGSEQSRSPDRTGLVRKIDREKGFQKAAQFLLLLEKDKAASVLSQLSAAEVEGITREIIALQNLDGREAKKVLAEFGLSDPAPDKTTAIAGGLETAAAMLAAAVGEDRSREILSRVEKKLATGEFVFLKSLGEAELERLLAGESPQVLSVVFAHLEASAASQLLKKLPPETQKEVVRRIARMDKLLPEVIRRTADALKKKLFSQGNLSMIHIDGKSALRDILKHMDFGQEQTILDQLSDEKPELARELEAALFTVDILRRLTYRDLQGFFRELVDRDLALLCRGETEEFREYVMAAVSNRRRARIAEEESLMGEVPAATAAEAKQTVLAVLKQKIGTGMIVLPEGKDATIV